MGAEEVRERAGTMAENTDIDFDPNLDESCFLRLGNLASAR
jgi:hypothetical protein